MKKYCCWLFLTVWGGLAASAQVELGVKAGLSIPTVRYKDQTDPQMSAVGFNGGFLAKIQVSQGFFIRPEVQYSRKGYRQAAIGGPGTGTTRLNYVAVPILAGFPFGGKFEGLIGPEFGYMTKATSVFSGNKTDITDNFQHFDWGLDLGATYAITSNLGAELRYNFGFRGLVKGITTDMNGTPNGSAKDGANRVFQAGLFYLFDQ
jgi:hypothetical protein